MRESASAKPTQPRLRVRVSFSMDSPAAQFLANASSDKMRRLMVEAVFERHFMETAPSLQSLGSHVEELANAIAEILVRRLADQSGLRLLPAKPGITAIELTDSDLDGGGKVTVRSDVQFDGSAFAQFLPKS
jgi:hypothetical protein